MPFWAHSEWYKRCFHDAQKQILDSGGFWDIGDLINGTMVITSWSA